MSFFRSLMGLEEKVVNADALTWTGLGYPTSKTGVPVSEYTALRTAVTFACCRVLTDDIGGLPMKILRQVDRSKSIATEHPLFRVVSRRPNQWQTSMEWRQTQLLHALLTKGGYSWINRSSSGAVLELVPLLPNNVTPHQDPDGTVWYEIADGKGKITEALASEVHSIHGMAWNGITGLDVVRYGGEAIGLTIATEEAQARLHGNGARPGGALVSPKPLNAKQIERIKKQFGDSYSGVQNAFKTILLDDGIEWKPFAMSSVEAQQLETRKHQIEEVCRFFRVFPAMVGYSDKSATYASAEAFFIAHVAHSLMPWVNLWEQAIERDLLTEQDLDRGYQAHFRVQGLMRGDAKSRGEFYATGINSGWMTRNEARELEDLNPLPGLDEVLQPMNMTKPGAPAHAGGSPATPAK